MFRLVALVFAATLLAPPSTRAGEAKPQDGWVTRETHRLGAYRVERNINEAEGEEQVVIRRDKTILRVIGGERYKFGQRVRAGYAPAIAAGADITNDGIPDLLVEGFSGGAHCCFTYYVFSMGDEVREIAELDTRDAGATFRNVDDEPDLEALSADVNFAYWYTSYAESPLPRITFKYRDGRYRLAPDLMRAPQIAEDELIKAADEIARSDRWGPPDPKYPNDPHLAANYEPRLWEVMLDLIYSGHYSRAVLFFEQAWPEAQPDKEKFRYEFFQCQLRRSRYWSDIASMNGLEPLPPNADCPKGPLDG